jgi:hypothetical protein
VAGGGVSLWGGAGRNGIELKGASLYVCIRRLTSAYDCMRLHTIRKLRLVSLLFNLLFFPLFQF